MLVKRAAGEEFWEENLTLCWQDRHQRTLEAPKNHNGSSVFDNRTTFRRSNCRIFVIACDHRPALRENRN